jgi:hypothetical protein
MNNMFRRIIGTSALGVAGMAFFVNRTARVEKHLDLPPDTLISDLKPSFKQSDVKGLLQDSYTITLHANQFTNPNALDLAKAMLQDGKVIFPQKLLFQMVNRREHPRESTNLKPGEHLIGNHFIIRESSPVEFIVTSADPGIDMNLSLRVETPNADQVTFRLSVKGWTTDEKSAELFRDPKVNALHEIYSKLLLDNAVRRLTK